MASRYLKPPGKGQEITAEFLQELAKKVDALWNMKVSGATFLALEGGCSLDVKAGGLEGTKTITITGVLNGAPAYAQAVIVGDITFLPGVDG